MPVRHVIDKIQGLVITTGWDRVSWGEVLAHDFLRKNPDFDPSFNQLVDARAVTDLELSIHEAKAIPSDSPFSAASRRAFLASSLLVLGAARLMESYSRRPGGTEEIRVFHEPPSALRWLGLESLPQ